MATETPAADGPFAPACGPLTAALLIVVNLLYRSLILFKRIPVAAWTWTRRVDFWGHVAAVVVYFGYAITFYVR